MGSLAETCSSFTLFASISECFSGETRRKPAFHSFRLSFISKAQSLFHHSFGLSQFCTLRNVMVNRIKHRQIFCIWKLTTCFPQKKCSGEECSSPQFPGSGGVAQVEQGSLHFLSHPSRALLSGHKCGSSEQSHQLKYTPATRES